MSSSHRLIATAALASSSASSRITAVTCAAATTPSARVIPCCDSYSLITAFSGSSRHPSLSAPSLQRSLSSAAAAGGSHSHSHSQSHSNLPPSQLSHHRSRSISPHSHAHDLGPRHHRAGPHHVYSRKVGAKELREDPHQWNTVAELQKLHDRILNHPEPPVVAVDYSDSDPKGPHLVGLEQLDAEVDSIFSLIFRRSSRRKKEQAPVTENAPSFGPQGLYLYGDVGSGKTMTMDLLYNSLPESLVRKRRVHFHAFMLDVHRRVHALRKERNVTFDPIPPIAQELTNDAWVLCFDELQVNDITDAMLLRRLFYELFVRGVVMVITSNRQPDDLYKNGIQRKSFLPTIDLLKERCLVHCLDSGIDYRKLGTLATRVFFHPLNEESQESIDKWWSTLTKGQMIESRTLHFLGRTLVVPESCGRVGKVSFNELCGAPHSSADYLEVARAFDVLVLTDVPRMTLFQRNEARRFITLIDALYDNKVKLIMSSEVDSTHLLTGDIEEEKSTASLSAADRLLMDDLKLDTAHLSSSIFTGGEEMFAFQRAVSRLTEMQSSLWTSTLTSE
ncbi:AFG1-like ATPase-domain-containing protein [Zopfochytrium polystomum]|nr:AFG1-like ATPase-domain-containing protein [Zopfochytrium polystomum]